ncbi:hypothetical protein VP01_3405g1 [Puccinia sorghi]|uniref:Integrase catalytic domain-containing protein n=1 Tax=Puccinia sorghi TaxID=27349 RepID=A0A0L6UYG7_9BASI|nr:hypothetical protein VP01_3405g1 [Puccinia sorghi]
MSLGHVSFCRLQRKLGIPIKASEICKSCAVMKITKASFKHRLSTASKPFEELHLDLIGPISPISRKNHKYILTIAKIFGYYPPILHSDRSTEFVNVQMQNFCKLNIIRQQFSDEYSPQQNGLAERFNRTVIEWTVMLDSGLKPYLWSEALSSCTLALNQIPSHNSKKSPFELFKRCSVPLDFFKPIGNPVAVLSNQKKSKLEPRGDFGKLVGLNVELKSYWIKLDNGRFVSSKSVKFLDFNTNTSGLSDYGDLLVEDQKRESITLKPIQAEVNSSDSERTMKQEDLDESNEIFDNNSADDGDSSENEQDVADLLIPDSPVGQILQERTLQVKPVQYTHFSEDPSTFHQAISSNNSVVWIDQFEEPEKHLNSTWGFLQTFGEEFFETFVPTGKFPSLLALLVLAIDLKLPIKQFDTPKGSRRKAPYLKLLKSLYGLKQATKNWYETLTSWFQEIDYCPSVSDACLFIHKDKNSFIFFHVDNWIVVGQPEVFEKLFLDWFPNSMAHSPDTLLGMNLHIENDSIGLSQPGLIKKGLEFLGLEQCRPVQTPLTPAVQLHTATDEDHDAFKRLNINYQSFTGMLNYLACRTRPDLASAVSILSKFNQKPGLSHWKEFLHFWNGSLAFWKSCPIRWNSKKQRNITMSSTESEMNALSDGEQENEWLSFLIEELWRIKLAPTLFHIDNKGLLEKLKFFGSNSKKKHLDIKIKNLREKFNKVADSLTKAAPHSSIKKLQEKCLSVLSSSSKEGC